MADFTFYPDKRLVRRWGWTDPTRSIDVVMSFKRDPRELQRHGAQHDEGHVASAKLHRAIVCGCYAGKYCAVTARTTDHEPEADTLRIDPPDRSRERQQTLLHKWPADSDEPGEQKKREENATFVDSLWSLAEHGYPVARHGVVVIAGETATRKTAFAREMARRYLSNVMGIARTGERPHVITYEDPIESRFAKSPVEASEAGFEYTPREKGKDVRSLEHAVMDALRQKPALLYVNEVRVEKDWRSLLYFAGTGHFAITTTHAGSLVEAFGRVLSAAKADIAARRSEIAGRIVAILHLRWLAGELVPALWVQTPRGRTALTQEGLGSLLPGEHGSCYGRTYFAKAMNLGPAVLKAAVISDLNGE